MNLNLTPQPQQSQYQSPTLPMTREQKASDFTSSALPTALFAGSQALNFSASAGATTSASTLSATAGTLGSTASIAGGVIGALQIAMNWGKSSPTAGASSGMAVGATIGTMICPGVGTAIGAGIGAIAGGLIGCITAGKHKDQKVRDAVREHLVNAGVLDSDYQIQLADGTRYDMGKDGGPRAEFGGRRAFEVDFSQPLAHYAVGWMDPIIALFAAGNPKVASDFTGYFANAALTNAKDLNDVRRNIEVFMTKFGLTNEKLAQGIIQLAQSGYIDEGTARGWIAGIQQRANPRFNGGPELTRKEPLSSAGQPAQE